MKNILLNGNECLLPLTVSKLAKTVNPLNWGQGDILQNNATDCHWMSDCLLARFKKATEVGEYYLVNEYDLYTC